MALLLLSSPSRAGEDPKVAAEIMALARAQWASEAAGKSVTEQMAGVADDYTEFNPDYGARVDGKVAPSNAKSTPGPGGPMKGGMQQCPDCARPRFASQPEALLTRAPGVAHNSRDRTNNDHFQGEEDRHEQIEHRCRNCLFAVLGHAFVRIRRLRLRL
jgi:hypothetical protein